jgi:hypothetical protein
VLQLVLDLTPERLAALYRALPDAMRQALDAPVARVLNARLPAVRRQPEALKLRALRAWLVRERDEALAGELLRAYLLGPRKALVIGFLDATGVRHEDGQVGDDAQPDAAKIPAAVEALLKDHARDDVRLYLGVAALQWPGNAGVRDALRTL